MVSYALVDQAEEDALHKTRLLNVEEKPFKRITKRLLAPGSLTSYPVMFPPSPLLDSSVDINAALAVEAEGQGKVEEWRQFREDVTLDFAAFESSIARIQFLLTSNDKERERYAAEKLRIQATAQAVRDNTAELHDRLGEAQQTLALRKTYDELAEKITNNRLLRPREDQEVNLQKLRAEILELEKESREYAKTWSERREQFGRIVEEGMQLRRLIRDEKAEVERREGMQEGEDGDDGDLPSKGRTSGVSTPRPDHDNSTASQPGHEDTSVTSSGLQGDKNHSGLGPNSRLRRSVTAPEEKNVSLDADNATMVDEGEVTGDEDTARTERLDDLEEGEEILEYKTGDRMDIS